MANYVVDPAAEDDIRDICQYVEQDNPQAAKNIIVAAYKAFALLALNPRMAPRQKYAEDIFQDVRCWPIAGYSRYVIFYRPISDGIQVIHVYDDARDIETLLETEFTER